MAAYAEVGRWLGLGVAHLVAIVDPSVVLLGGGMSIAGDLILGPARAACSEHVGAPRLRPRQTLALARLGADAGVVGRPKRCVSSLTDAKRSNTLRSEPSG